MKCILLWIFFCFLSFTRFRDFILRKDCGHFGHLRGAVGCLKLVPRLRECFFGASSEFVEIFINIFEQIMGRILGLVSTFFIQDDKDKQNDSINWQFSRLYMLNACGNGTNHKQNLWKCYDIDGSFCWE